MSSDNYYMIAKEPDGRYVVSMGFDSDEEWPLPHAGDPRFANKPDAIAEGFSHYSEYGVRIHPSAEDHAVPLNTFRHETPGRFRQLSWSDTDDGGKVLVITQGPRNGVFKTALKMTFGAGPSGEQMRLTPEEVQTLLVEWGYQPDLHCAGCNGSDLNPE